MAIIRNDRRAREVAAEQARETEEEAEVDYTWRPTEEEYPLDVSVDDWCEMLEDPAIFDEDGLNVLECFFNYGSPATFQQLSVRYRGTMGRYRRWLNSAAERAGARLGVEPPAMDRFGNPDWSGVLALSRPAGKVAAGMREYRLRDELEGALRRRAARQAEAKKAADLASAKAQAKSAAQERLAEARRKSVDQAAVERAMADRAAAERARAEREAKLAAMAIPAADEPVEEFDDAFAAAVPLERRDAAEKDVEAAAATPAPAPAAPTSPSADAAPAGAVTPESAAAPTPVCAAAAPGAAPELPALAALVEALGPREREVREGLAQSVVASRRERRRPSERGLLDYASTYAERLYEAVDLIAASDPTVTAARLARAAGDESVEGLQRYLNGEAVPGFAYLDRLCAALGLSAARLDASEDAARALPVFETLSERLGAEVAHLPALDAPREVLLVSDGSASARAGVVLGFGELRYALLDRGAVATRGKRADALAGAFEAARRELCAWADAEGVPVREVRLDAPEWDELAAGRLWPGAVAALGE
ncbi:MAG: hypothetical protein SOZ36_07225 [Atopobiaceae bacterium]|nr:hypothetical protein [Atopobiaceae bacterium]